MSTTTSTGALIGGLIIPVVAGVLNGSWNAAFSPVANLAVAPPTSTRKHDLDHMQSWALFQFYAAIANIIICIYWVGGPERVSWIISEASARSVGLVVVFSWLMGVGILLFGEACRIAGVGLGTNLTIGIITVLGTLLPLAMNNQVATPPGGMIMGGLAICCIGLYFSMKALQLKTDDEAEEKMNDNPQKRATDLEDETGEKALEEGYTAAAVTNEESDIDKTAQQQQQTPEKTYSTFFKITICFFAALFSSTLQFAFVFGDELIKIAESDDGPGSTPKTGSAQIIWLFVIPISTVSSISYGLYQSRDIPLSNIIKSPFMRHVKIFCCASLPWIGHILLYGIAANVLLPPRLAAAIAWPVLMASTVAWGMILSFYLGEWKTASDGAKTKQKIGLGLMSLGIIVVMCSVAL